MSLNIRTKWLIGGMVGMALLGGCGDPASQDEATPSQLGSSAQEISVRDVSVSLSVAKTALSAQEDVAVTVTLTNQSLHPVKLLEWYVPGAGLKDALFEVTRDGSPVEYLGPHIKRAAPQEKDFITLAPGDSLTRTASLADYDLSKTGNYTVHYLVDSQQAAGLAATNGAQLRSNDLTLVIEGRANVIRGAKPGPITASLSTTNCTSTRASTISSAVSAATNYANSSYSYLSGTPSATSRYVTWFGTYSSTGWSTAKTHFAAIKDAFATKAVVVDCSCTDSGTYAYVYPTQPYKIYVCGAFWSAPMTGTDSKGGTLIHEMSHFNVVASTDDWAYGQTAAKNLAKSSPSKALDNADNHEYFAENNPSLP